MSTIHLMVEDENDGIAVRKILKKKGFKVNIKIYKPAGGSGGISRLAKQLERLIASAKAERKQNDCIAVMHDQDDQNQQNYRDDYHLIKKICAKERVKLVIARDELEAWFLADTSLCQWLEITPRNWDEQKKPSDELRSLLAKKKMKYQGRSREEVFNHLDGSGDKFSNSMQEALTHLKDAPCIRE